MKLFKDFQVSWKDTLVCCLNIVALSGCVSVLAELTVGIALSEKPVLAESKIIPDNSLGAESSVVVPFDNVGFPIDVINGGAIRKVNLFHSFQEFNVGELRGVYFQNPSNDIQNILARVTGQNRSEIFGILGIFNHTGVTSNPNLFLINPNGIVFGKYATLDVQGSFVATTANAIQFGNQGVFSATNAQAPPLLTVNPSALLFNQINKNAVIQNNGVLLVPLGRSLALVGGNINLDRGVLFAPGGKIDLGGLAEAGTVALGVDSNNLNLKFPENVTRADVSLTNQAFVYVRGGGGGNIAINARNLDILGGSFLSAGIGAGLGTPETVAGDISLNATGDIKVAGFGSGIENFVLSGAKGNGGNITIGSGSFSLQDGAALSASTFGQGNAGNVTVRAKNAVSLANTAIFSTVEGESVGNGGNIDISAASLSLTHGAKLEASNSGQGNAGNILLQAQDNISANNSFILSNIGSPQRQQALGNVGNIDLSARTVSLTDGAQLQAGFYSGGQGNAGLVSVKAQESISFTGKNSGIFADVESGAVGNGSNIQISAPLVSFTNGVGVTTSNAGQGSSGKITITAGSFFLNNAVVTTSNTGQGNAGNILVQAQDNISANNNSLIASNIGSLEGQQALGNVGNIDLSARTVSLTDRAQLQAGFYSGGQGNAGLVSVKAQESISFTGKNSGIFTDVESGAGGNGSDIQIFAPLVSFTNGAGVTTSNRGQGNSGKINIMAGSFFLNNGAGVIASNLGKGIGGTVNINASDALTISKDSFINTRLGAGAIGRGGDINIQAGNVFVTDGVTISSSSLGEGIAGDINIKADTLGLNKSQITAQAASTDGGNINVNLARYLLLRNDSQISTNAGTAEKGGNGGNININSKFILAVPKENSDISANAFTGTGGNIQINSQGIFGIESRPKLTQKSDITASSELGVSGVIKINVPDTSSIQNSLTELPQNAIDTNALIANSCISRGTKRQENSFTITGSGALRYTPGGVLTSAYTTGDVRSVEPTPRPWKKGDPIIEPQGLYQLPNGQLILSRSC
ncbi:filamentous hemagglutinin N-terminal domain-containing protein [Nostoc sp. ChiQUE01b]|uniref:two-partner secretion domain-containing protein n=1 Tax=Nostoc sp. ChiQUE01b TaxID=3075376 RepID=UPI002AD440C5|nr:filamentous hemagglutinin N-terminal domain-containing protein [Nostoc sp. ChiQUE01b]MDZ8257037.1 filamentous hemagglutinin N-terminal domain-containing protein [Nostoc sp. ChiQUE01b]